jgi:hypothetical protein
MVRSHWTGEELRPEVVWGDVLAGASTLGDPSLGSVGHTVHHVAVRFGWSISMNASATSGATANRSTDYWGPQGVWGQVLARTVPCV